MPGSHGARRPPAERALARELSFSSAGPVHATPRRMGIVHKAVATVGQALSGVHAGDDKLASQRLAAQLPTTLRVRSPDFNAGEPLPISCTVDGAGTPPTLS